MELDSDLAKLSDAESYLNTCKGRLLVLDEIQRKPDLFRILRSIIDTRIFEGERTAQFLLLGSASPEMLRHSSESLAGRIRFIELSPYSGLEVNQKESEDSSLEELWVRGGFPGSYLSPSTDASWAWGGAFIDRYIERDLMNLGMRFSPETMRNLWSMLAWRNAQQFNMSQIAGSLGVSYKTVGNYVDLLISGFVARKLKPWSANLGKRLVKSPKILLRDSGLTHRILRIANYQDLLGHPTVGASWKAFAIENVLRECSDKWEPSYFRTHSGAEIDLVPEGPGARVRAIEIKRSTAPKASRGFYEGCKDVGATEKFVVYPGSDRFPIGNDVDAIGLTQLLSHLRVPHRC